MDGYKGNAIFRNQPNHSYFDKSFEDPKDCFFLSLNEINPYFMQPEQLQDKRGFENNTIKDPRTQNSITQLTYDHTREIRTKTFRSSQFSAMQRPQHILCVRVMKALQDEDEVEEEDLYNWRRLEGNRIKEKQEFQKCVYEFNQSNKQLIYKPANRLLDLYQKWYKGKQKSLMIKYPEESYNTHLGLPQVRFCKTILKDQRVTVINQEIVAKLGRQWIWQDDSNLDFRKFQYFIEEYMQEYINSEDLKDSLDNEIKTQFLDSWKKDELELPLFYVPLESLLFLLTTGDYADLSTEMLFEIKEDIQKEGDFKKTIIMETPLPSRQCGWHTYKQVVNQAALAFHSLNQTQKWTKISEDLEEDDIPEIQGSTRNFTNYKLSTHADYIQNCKLTPNKYCKFSKSLIKWQLNPLETETTFQIYTPLNQPCISNSKDPYDSLASVSIKLEYKTQFGCEIMTKYEMLEEWFKLKLLQASKSICLRLDVKNFQTLLKEKLTLQKLEQYLSTLYHIDLTKLLTNLYEFFKMLYTMPAGQYMLRYNPKFKDKLMLCKPSQEITQNTIHLHQLLQTDPSDLLFMSQQNFLPISEHLCSLMHIQHQVIPCAFRPPVKNQQRPQQQQKGKIKHQQQPVKKLNDKDWIMKRLERQKELDLQKSKQLNTNRKKQQRTRRKQRLLEAQKIQDDKQKEQDEIDKEIQLDNEIFGF